MAHGAQQGAAQQELVAEDALVDRARILVELLRHPDAQDLLRVVPLVEGAVGVEALVALQANQFGVEHARQHLGDVGLADARLSLEQDRLAELRGEHDGQRQRTVGDVVLRRERSLHGLDGIEGDGVAHLEAPSYRRRE